MPLSAPRKLFCASGGVGVCRYAGAWTLEHSTTQQILRQKMCMSAYSIIDLSCHDDVLAPGQARTLVQVRRAGLAHSGLQHLAQPESCAQHKPKQPLHISRRLGDLAPGPKTLQLSDTIPTVSLTLLNANAWIICTSAPEL